MAVQIRNLCVLAYANGFTLWHYKTGVDRLAAIRVVPGYFNDVRDMFTPGDMIVTTAVGGSTVLVVASTANEEVLTASLS